MLSLDVPQRKTKTASDPIIPRVLFSRIIRLFPENAVTTWVAIFWVLLFCYYLHVFVFLLFLSSVYTRKLFTYFHVMLDVMLLIYPL